MLQFVVDETGAYRDGTKKYDLSPIDGGGENCASWAAQAVEHTLGAGSALARWLREAGDSGSYYGGNSPNAMANRMRELLWW